MSSDSLTMTRPSVRREQSYSPVAQGSSLSYSLRQPPSGFGSFGLSGLGSGSGSGFGSLPSLSGLTSSLTSGFGSGFGLSSGLGSGLTQQNLFASASGYNPVVLPATGGGSIPTGSRWGSSKVLAASPSDQSYESIGYMSQANSQVSSASNPSSGSTYAWTSSNAAPSYPTYSGSSSQTAPSQSSYSASSYNPSPYSGSSYSAGGNQYQRSSSASAFKPIISSNSYSSGLIGSASAPTASYSPSVASKAASAPSAPSVASGSIVSSGSNTLSSSYSTQ